MGGQVTADPAVRIREAALKMRSAPPRTLLGEVYAEIQRDSYDEGYRDGDRSGYDEGHRDGFNEGLERGRREAWDGGVGLSEYRELRPGPAAAAWIRWLLRDGPLRHADVKACAARDGHAWRTIERAKAGVGAVSRPGRVDGGRTSWWWKLPEQTFPWE